MVLARAGTSRPPRIYSARQVKSSVYLVLFDTLTSYVAGVKAKVWGVGIHADVVSASLMALLSCAASVSSIFNGMQM